MVIGKATFRLRAGRCSCQEAVRRRLRVFALFLGLAGCSEPVPHRAGPTRNQVEVEGVRLDRWEKDELRHRARAASARFDRSRRHVEANSVEIDAFDHPSGVRTARASAPNAAIDLKTDAITLFGGVTIADREGRTVETSTVVYQPKAGLARAPGPVVVRGSNFEAHAPSLELDVNQKTLKAPGKISAQIKP